MPKTLRDVGEDLACNAESLVWQVNDIAHLIADGGVPRDMVTELIAMADELVSLSDQMAHWAITLQMHATAKGA